MPDQALGRFHASILIIWRRMVGNRASSIRLAVMSLTLALPWTSPIHGQTSLSMSSVSQPNELLICYGDILGVKVLSIPELDEDTRVEADGNVMLYLIGNIHVVGNSLAAAASLIRKALIDGGFVRSPQVMVEVVSFASPDVLVTGQVVHPGRYHLERTTSLANILDLAGGRTSHASDDFSVTTNRTSNGQPSVFKTKDVNALDHIRVFPGDTVTVGHPAIFAVHGVVIQSGNYVLQGKPNSILHTWSEAYGPTVKGKTVRVCPSGSGAPGISEQYSNLLALEDRRTPDVRPSPTYIIYLDRPTPADKGASVLRLYRHYLSGHQCVLQ